MAGRWSFKAWSRASNEPRARHRPRPPCHHGRAARGRAHVARRHRRRAHRQRVPDRHADSGADALVRPEAHRGGGDLPRGTAVDHAAARAIHDRAAPQPPESDLVTAAPSFDLFAPGSAQVLALFGARVSGLVLVAPVFSARTVPVMVRTALVVVLTVLLQPVAMSHLTMPPALTPAAFLSETLVGFAIGMGAAIIVGAAEAAGELLAVQIGLSGAAVR